MTPVEHPYWVWGLFFGIVFVALFVDIVIVNRKPHAPTKKETVVWSIIWVSLALAFNAFIYWQVGNHTGDWTLAFTQAKLFLTGYLIELSLSVDNLFVFLLIFTFFKVPKKFQHRVLFWGIMGALVLRMMMIFAGAELVERFHWIIYIFGVFLVYTGISMFKTSDDNFEPHESAIVKFATKYIRISKHYDGDKFFVIQDGARVGTLLLLVLITVEFTDLVFAVDSIPAIFGITTDKFLVYTSNIFAILGLRTFYFLLAGLAERFHLLKYGLAVVLTFIGIKMLLPLFAQGLIMFYGADGGPEPLRNFVAGKYDSQVVDISLIVVIATIAASVVLSLIFPPRHGSKPADGE
ncbi:MAG TPA: TerC family protein [Pyrinomonadaceae bacterium]|nr:TerC family protein [Pyrinomonadaceae bacterium]